MATPITDTGISGTSGTYGDCDDRSTEVVPSRRGTGDGADDMGISDLWRRLVRDHRGTGLFDAVCKLFGKSGQDWGSMVANGDVDSVIDAALRGDKSAQEFLDDPKNLLAVQREMQKQTQMQNLVSQVSASEHERAMAAIRNIPA